MSTRGRPRVDKIVDNLNMKQDLFIKQMEIGPMQNYVYFIGDKKTNEVALVDPGWDPKKILKEAEEEGFNISHILLTHTHYDHVNALEEILKATDAQVYVHAQEAPFLSFAGQNLKKIKGGDRLKIGSNEIEFLHTPGHTPGSQCFLVNGNLVSGDTLFIDYCGRTDLPGGDPEQMYSSLHDVLGKLPAETVLYPGHNYASVPTSTIERELKENRYMAAPSLEDFLRL